jgi:hypothetical protein
MDKIAAEIDVPAGAIGHAAFTFVPDLPAEKNE